MMDCEDAPSLETLKLERPIVNTLDSHVGPVGMQGELFANSECEHWRKLLRELAELMEQWDTSKGGVKSIDVSNLARAALKALDESPMPTTGERMSVCHEQ